MNNQKKYLIELCKARLGLSKIQVKDGNNKIVEVENSCDDQLSTLLDLSLDNLCHALNKIFTFNDRDEVIKYSAILTQGAYVMFLAGRALLEKGREYEIVEIDEDTSFMPPKMSAIIQKQWEIEFADYQKKLEELKPKLHTVTYPFTSTGTQVFPNKNNDIYPNGWRIEPILPYSPNPYGTGIEYLDNQITCDNTLNIYSNEYRRLIDRFPSDTIVG